MINHWNDLLEHTPFGGGAQLLDAGRLLLWVMTSRDEDDRLMRRVAVTEPVEVGVTALSSLIAEAYSNMARTLTNRVNLDATHVVEGVDVHDFDFDETSIQDPELRRPTAITFDSDLFEPAEVATRVDEQHSVELVPMGPAATEKSFGGASRPDKRTLATERQPIGAASTEFSAGPATVERPIEPMRLPEKADDAPTKRPSSSPFSRPTMALPREAPATLILVDEVGADDSTSRLAEFEDDKRTIARPGAQGTMAFGQVDELIEQCRQTVASLDPPGKLQHIDEKTLMIEVPTIPGGAPYIRFIDLEEFLGRAVMILADIWREAERERAKMRAR